MPHAHCQAKGKGPGYTMGCAMVMHMRQMMQVHLKHAFAWRRPDVCNRNSQFLARVFTTTSQPRAIRVFSAPCARLSLPTNKDISQLKVHSCWFRPVGKAVHIVHPSRSASRIEPCSKVPFFIPGGVPVLRRLFVFCAVYKQQSLQRLERLYRTDLESKRCQSSRLWRNCTNRCSRAMVRAHRRHVSEILLASRCKPPCVARLRTLHILL